ncbi:hypoxanthine guanine phosphoribosyltransferase [Streptococcus pneumoniae]|nr:hypoxanthine guanine phosphoribosyltransferase [Streptococcus pneumoniae]
MLENDIKKVLVSHDEITEAAKKLGAQLTKDYAGKNPILVGILKGSIPFMAELVKHIDTHIEMDFMMVSSYHGGTASSGVINIKQDVTQDIKGRHVLFVEDIIDTGQTLSDEKDKETAFATKLKDEDYAAKYTRAKYYYSKSREKVYTIPDLLQR